MDDLVFDIMATREQLRQLVKRGDPSQIPANIAYPGAETVLLANTPEMVRVLVGSLEKRDLATKILLEFEKSPKTLIFKTIYSLLDSYTGRITLFNPRESILLWVLQKGDKRITIGARHAKRSIQTTSRERIAVLTKLSLPPGPLVAILSFTEPFSPRELEGLINNNYSSACKTLRRRSEGSHHNPRCAAFNTL